MLGNFTEFPDKNINNIVIIKPKADADIDELKAEVTQIMRNRRGLKPNEINTFFISVISGLKAAIDGIIGSMNLIGWMISLFSLLVGGTKRRNFFPRHRKFSHSKGVKKDHVVANRFAKRLLAPIASDAKGVHHTARF